MRRPDVGGRGERSSWLAAPGKPGPVMPLGEVAVEEVAALLGHRVGHGRSRQELGQLANERARRDVMRLGCPLPLEETDLALQVRVLALVADKPLLVPVGKPQVEQLATCL